MNKQELEDSIRQHALWFYGYGTGKRADFSDENLEGAYFRGEKFSDENLNGAYFRGQKFSCAILNGANFSRAKLSDAYFRGATLRRTDFRDADCSDANFSDADFRTACCRDTDFRRADLSGADFRNADLSGAKLWGASIDNCIGNGNEIKTIQTGIFTIVYTNEIMAIGEHQHSIREWFRFSDETIEAMGDGALDFWRLWKPMLTKIFNSTGNYYE